MTYQKKMNLIIMCAVVFLSGAGSFVCDCSLSYLLGMFVGSSISIISVAFYE